jgi:hypothetical protein
MIINQKIQTYHLLLYSFLSESKIWSLQVWKCRTYKAQTDWWENVTSLSWIFTPFWIFFFARKGAKVLVTTNSKLVYMLSSVEKWMCKSQQKKLWLMAPTSFNPPFWSFGKKNLLRYFFYRTFYLIPKFQLICIQFDLAMENLFHLDFLRHFVFFLLLLFF